MRVPLAAASTGASTHAKTAPITPSSTLRAGFRTDADAAEAAVIRRAYERRVNVASLYYPDWDPLKHGAVSRNQFIRGLTNAGLGLAAGVSPDGLEAIASRYALCPSDFGGAALDPTQDMVSYAAFAASVENAFGSVGMHTHTGPVPPSLAQDVVTAPRERDVRPVFDAVRAEVVATTLRDIRTAITRHRLFNFRFRDFDRVGEGLVSEPQFLRVLAQVGLVPTVEEQRSALLDYFRGPAGKVDLIDYRAFLATAMDAQTGLAR